MKAAKLIKNPGLGFALAVLLILLNPNVSEAALISRGSSNSSCSGDIAKYIGEEEFLMEPGAARVNARLLETPYIIYDALKNGQAVAGDKNAIALYKDNRGCQIYDRCRQGHK